MVVHTLNFERISKALLASVPRLAPDEQRVGLALYDALTIGEPVRRERLAEMLAIPTRRVVELLDDEALRRFTYYDEQRSVIGFGGLAVVPMHHRLVVNDRTLYAWCAWDTLFLPELLNARVSVASDCPETGETIRLTVGADGIEDASHPEARVSFLFADTDTFSGAAERTMATFCHFVFFFASPEAGQAWTSRHEGTCLLTLAQAFELGRRKNAAQFADAFYQTPS